MSLAERYYQLSMLGRVSFVESVAPAALLLHTSSVPRPPRLARGTESSQMAEHFESNDLWFEENDPETEQCQLGPHISWKPQLSFEILPLTKKAGTPFIDLITIGRTRGNDLCLDDSSVSRFQAFFRLRVGQWFLCDAGSRNGTKVAGKRVPTRTEVPVVSRSVLQFGTVQATFYTADSLYDRLANGV